MTLPISASIAVAAALFSSSAFAVSPPKDGCRSVSSLDPSGDATIGIVQCDPGRHDGAVGLIVDLSVSDVHFQPWMLLVTGIVVFWFLYVWATR